MTRAKLPGVPSEAFKRWAMDFDRRHRFGIPTTPPGPLETVPQPPTEEEAPMPPAIVPLPPRAGSMRFTDEDVAAVIELLKACEPGQAVRLTDAADDSDNTARRRAELMKEQIEKAIGDEPIRAGHKIRGHVLTAGEGKVKTHKSKKTNKEYKITQYPENWGAVSLVPENTPEESENGSGDTPPAPPENPEPPATQPRQTRRR